MSYILDALKKDQAQQTEGVSINVHTTTPTKRMSPWVPILGVALILNAGVLGWILWKDTAADDNGSIAQLTTPESSNPVLASSVSEPTIATSANTQQADPQSRPRQVAAEARPEPVSPVPIQVAPTRPATSERTVTPERTVVPSSSGVPTAPINHNIETYALSDLPGDQRARFAQLSYTSHIYTRDASLRAIVVNGERLQAGDEILDLTVYEITETGVVFEQVHAGTVRRVAVNPFE